MKQLVGSEVELYAALRSGAELGTAVPAVLDILERDPLASAGYFRGDLLRALIDLTPDFWRRNRELFRRYQGTIRAGAIARRSLPCEERMEFWS
jgi:hypothetical protein